MIYAFTGKTGSGKTWNMVHEAFKSWRRGVDIYSNTTLFYNSTGLTWLEKIRNMLSGYVPKRGRIVYFQHIDEILEVRDGLILFDEAQVLFNARNWDSLPDEFQYKLQQHRKHNLDLYCTTQNMGTIDIMYRRLVQVWFHHEPIFRLTDWFQFHRVLTKDIDQLYNQIDDLKVDNIDSRVMWISSLKQVLYDTLYDIGFKRFKIIWLTSFLPKSKKTQMKAFIIPKKMDLKGVSSALYTFRLNLGQKK